MYKFYLDYMLLPVTPSSVTFEIANKNQTVDLINEGEINIIKPAGLTTITFDALLPAHNYGFLATKEPHTIEYYLEKIEMLKRMRAPFDFRILRDNGRLVLPDQQFDVTLENYTIEQDDDTQDDFMLRGIKLKQYRPYYSKTVKVDGSGKAVVSQKRVVVNRTVSELSNGTYKVPLSSFTVNMVTNLLVGSNNVQASDTQAVLNANKSTIAKAKGISAGNVTASTTIPAGTKLAIPAAVLKKAGVS